MRSAAQRAVNGASTLTEVIDATATSATASVHLMVTPVQVRTLIVLTDFLLAIHILPSLECHDRIGDVPVLL